MLFALILVKILLFNLLVVNSVCVNLFLPVSTDFLIFKLVVVFSVFYSGLFEKSSKEETMMTIG